jgi:hypothetical protein
LLAVQVVVEHQAQEAAAAAAAVRVVCVPRLVYPLRLARH